jgi:hypothetical protein
MADINISQHSLSNLIDILLQIQQIHGDLDVVYWDQQQAVRFDDIETMIQINNKKVYFGGFHVNGTEFYELDNDLNVKPINNDTSEDSSDSRLNVNDNTVGSDDVNDVDDVNNSKSSDDASA